MECVAPACSCWPIRPPTPIGENPHSTKVTPSLQWLRLSLPSFGATCFPCAGERRYEDFRCRWAVAKGLVWADGIVMAPPALDHDLGSFSE
jgi:hypothetical protein